jgi:anti-sigma regulatory factor (Ser/Thr protein kinase)
VRTRLRTWLADAGADERECQDVVAALTEALAPTAGVPDPPAEPAMWVISAELVGGVVEVAVDTRPMHEAPVSTDRGRGLVLMEAFSDELSIQRGDDADRVRLSRRLANPRTRR